LTIEAVQGVVIPERLVSVLMKKSTYFRAVWGIFAIVFLGASFTYSCAEGANVSSLDGPWGGTVGIQLIDVNTIEVNTEWSEADDVYKWDADTRSYVKLLDEELMIERFEVYDVNGDGYGDIVVNTGGTWNETHDLYIWDAHTQSYKKVIYKGFEMLAEFTVYDGYIKNFIRGDSPDDSRMEKLIWNGNILTRDSEWEKVTDALNLLFRYLYDDEILEGMINIDFFDNDEFLGYEYQLFIGANPMRIEFVRMSENNNYYIFWLNERVHHDGEFSHATTLNYFAVDKESKEIIAERNESSPEDWNDEFPW